jgi:hypothetical protein
MNISKIKEIQKILSTNIKNINNEIIKRDRKLKWVAEKENKYTIKLHKEKAIKELKERGYDKDIIDKWIEYI